MNQRLQDCGANGKGAMHRAIPAPDIVTGGSIGAITAARCGAGSACLAPR
jgi:hypothetical protein